MVQSHLIPEPRADKNGVVVTRHVRPAQAPALGRGIPSPAAPLAAPHRELEPEEMRVAVLDRLEELGRLQASGSRAALHSHMMRFGRNELAPLMDVLPDLDQRGAASIFDGADTERGSDNGAAQRLATVIDAYPVAREIDDAVLPGEYSKTLVTRDCLYRFARDFFHRTSAPGWTYRHSDEHAADLRGAYLLNRLGLSEKNCNSTGNYYRMLARIDREYEDIRPRLPLLIAAHTAYDGGTDWYFGDADAYLFTFLDDIRDFPLESIVPIAEVTLRRGEYDQEIAQQIADGAYPAISDGLL